MENGKYKTVCSCWYEGIWEIVRGFWAEILGEIGRYVIYNWRELYRSIIFGVKRLWT